MRIVATGNIGRELVDQLLERRVEVRALTRHPDRFADWARRHRSELLDSTSSR